MNERFQPCEICGAGHWEVRYRGRVRDGSFGNLSREDGVVCRCSLCGAHRLNEEACKETVFYEGDGYKHLINEPEEEARSRAARNLKKVRAMNIPWPECIAGRKVAEIGCATGYFLEHLGDAADLIAIEPTDIYHQGLADRGYHVYPFAKEATGAWGGKVDLAFCFAVIEHTENPRLFLEEIQALLTPGGELIMSTPNHRDILMDLAGDTYKPFFYRTVHRWYFDGDSLGLCAREAGLDVVETRCVHRFGLSNAMAWLRDGRPTGSSPLPHLDSAEVDAFWKAYLEKNGIGDFLYMRFRRPTRDMARGSP